MLTFNLYLTGYDVQSINLADVLLRSTVAPPNGTSASTTPGSLSSATSANLRTPLDCANNPGSLPPNLIAAVRNALRFGTFAPPGATSCSNAVGGVHFNAIGYATIDVVANCTDRMPNDPLYYTTDLLFDNVLIGDYQNIGVHPDGEAGSSFDAGGNPMVHIRAVPEGGSAGSNVPTALPYTFYDRYTPATARTLDRRQPLPSTFAARIIQEGPAKFATRLTIWREGIRNGTCPVTGGQNVFLLISETVRFDEHENASVYSCCHGGPLNTSPPSLPATASTSSSDYFLFPVALGFDVGGWMYLNLNNGGSKSYSVTKDIGGMPGPTNVAGGLAPIGATTTIGPRPSQNWVTVTMFGTLGTNRLAAEFDAVPLGNGCSPAAFLSTANTPIGPAGGVFVCPPGPTLTNGTTTQCTGTNVNPPP